MNPNLPTQRNVDLPQSKIEQAPELILEPGVIYRFTPSDINKTVRIEYIPESEYDPLDLNIYIGQGERSESNYLDLELPSAIEFLEQKFNIKVTRAVETDASNFDAMQIVRIKVDFSPIEYELKSIKLANKD
jgi:hypothetical protein